MKCPVEPLTHLETAFRNHSGPVSVLSVNAVSAVISGLNCLYQQLRGRRAGGTLVAINAFST